MTETTEIQEGQVLRGSLFNEPMRVETVSQNRSGLVVAGLMGQRSNEFRRVPLVPAQIASLEITDPEFSYTDNGSLPRLGLKARSLGIAYEFDRSSFFSPHQPLQVGSRSLQPPKGNIT